MEVVMVVVVRERRWRRWLPARTWGEVAKERWLDSGSGVHCFASIAT